MAKKKKKHQKQELDLQKILSEWAVPILIITVILGSFIVVGVPSIQAIIEARLKLNDTQEDLAALTTKANTLATLNETQLNNQTQLVEKTLPSAKPVFAVLRSLQNQAQVSQVSISSFDVNPGNLATESANEVAKSTRMVRGQLSDLQMQITVLGTRDQVEEYITLLQKTAPLIEIAQMSLSRQGQDGEKVTAEIVINAYYSLPPETIGKAADKLPIFDDQDNETLQTVGSYDYFAQTPATSSATTTNKDNLFSF